VIDKSGSEVGLQHAADTFCLVRKPQSVWHGGASERRSASGAVVRGSSRYPLEGIPLPPDACLLAGSIDAVMAMLVSPVDVRDLVGPWSWRDGWCPSDAGQSDPQSQQD
jgi:hypothetical protein